MRRSLPGVVVAVLLVALALAGDRPAPRAATTGGRDSATARSGSPAVPVKDSAYGQGVALASRGCGIVWSSVTSPNPGGNHSMLRGVHALSDTDVWAVGAAGGTRNTMTEHWNGTVWSHVPSPKIRTEAYLYGVAAVSPNDVWAVGASRDASHIYQTLIMHYDGAAWTMVPSPNATSDNNYLNAVTAISPTNIWAVGYSEDQEGIIRTLILHYNGSSWQLESSPNPAASGNYLYGVSAASANDVWAVGFAYDPAVQNLQTLILHYQGAGWSMVASPNEVSGTANLLQAVAAPSADSAWAVGFANGTAGFDTVILRWDGTSWTRTGIDDGGGRLFGVAAVADDDVWAVGTDEDGATLIEHWDGAGWSVIETPSSISRSTIFHGISALPSGELRAVGYEPDTDGRKEYTKVQHLCQSVVNESGFQADKATVAIGNTAAWTFWAGNASSHTVTDQSGMGLFDSGMRPAGTSYTFFFAGAGTYDVLDSTTSDTMQIQVPVSLSPKSGGVTTEFTAQWASRQVTGYVFDIQIRRPGSSSWASWLSGQTSTSASFVPDSGVGNYWFRARIRNVANGNKSRYSPAQRITVT